MVLPSAASFSSDDAMRLLRLFLCWILVCACAHAGTLTQADVARRFPAPLAVGARAVDVPAWPLFKQNGTALALVGYAFESADLAPVPGFAGVPPNLLVVIPRRAECGTPCQTCRHRCGYNAIGASGTIAYEECFQCMECVVIHASDEQCAPRILERRRGRSIPIAPVPVIIDRRA
jgi:hypothetical protein